MKRIDNHENEKQRRQRQQFINRMQKKLDRKLYQEHMQYFDMIKRRLRTKPYRRVRHAI